MNEVLIVAGGPLPLSFLRTEVEGFSGKVIAVDGGGLKLAELGRRPDGLIGDFDSLPGPLLDEFIKSGVEIRRYPAAKDQTDLELALDWVMEQGAREVRILGGLGHRLDHTLGNVGLLVRALRRGVIVWLVDEMHQICAVDRRITLNNRAGWAVSLVPLPTALGVKTSGLQYPLQKENLYFDQSRGLHNRYIADEAVVELDQGLLLVILFKEDDDQPFLSF